LAFVLTLAFTPKFNGLTHSQLGVYIATLVLGAVAASLLMAPAAFNRLVFRQGLRRRVIIAANWFALNGLSFLLATVGCAALLTRIAVLLATLGCVFLLVHQVVANSSGLASFLTTAVVSWFVFTWFAIPAWWRFRHRECGSD